MRAKYLLFVPLFLLSLIATVHAQTKNNYTAQWRKIDSLIVKQGLTKSALAEVKKIYAAAKKEQNDVQVIKSLVYTMNLQEESEEEATPANIQMLEKEVASASQPAKSILQSLLAQTYLDYFRSRYWRLYNRTSTVDFKKEDIATWNAADFHKRITELYLASISAETLLQQTKLEPFDALIIKGNVRHLRPTLFDLLAHEALDYFKSDEREIAKPVNPFEISQAVAFAEPERFSSFTFTTTDSSSLHFK
ncbi:MAG: alpha-2-macroglobulin, partial [Chitinophagaceae bacterium]